MSDNEKPTGGPAFPGQMPTGYDPRSGNYFVGMTLRDYFAGQAMQAILSLRQNYLTAGKEAPGKEGRFLAQAAYEQADAMLAAREVKP